MPRYSFGTWGYGHTMLPLCQAAGCRCIKEHLEKNGQRQHQEPGSGGVGEDEGGNSKKEREETEGGMMIQG